MCEEEDSEWDGNGSPSAGGTVANGEGGEEKDDDDELVGEGAAGRPTDEEEYEVNDEKGNVEVEAGEEEEKDERVEGEVVGGESAGAGAGGRLAVVCGRLALVRREEVGGCEGTDMGCPLRLATLKVALPMKDLGAVGSCGEPSTTLAAAAAIEGGAEKAEEEEDVDGVVAEEAEVEVVVEDERAWRASACASISATSEVTPAEGCTVCLRTLNLVMKGDAADWPRPRPPRPLVGPAPIDVGGGSPPGPPSIFFTLLLPVQRSEIRQDTRPYGDTAVGW